VSQFDKVGRLCKHFPPAVMGKFRSCCTMGHYLQARPLLMPFVLSLLGVAPGSREERDLAKRSQADLMRPLMKRSPEIGMLYLYVESHIAAIQATGYGSHFQKRVHELTRSGLLMRPERSYEETKHGNRPDLADREERDQQALRDFAEKANKARMRSAVRGRIVAAVRLARGEIDTLDSWMEEAGPAVISK
jgi:hypothetical protein